MAARLLGRTEPTKRSVKLTLGEIIVRSKLVPSPDISNVTDLGLRSAGVDA